MTGSEKASNELVSNTCLNADLQAPEAEVRLPVLFQGIAIPPSDVYHNKSKEPTYEKITLSGRRRGCGTAALHNAPEQCQC
jgi:hypothetical protein